MLMSAIDRYLALRRALGYSLASAEPLLRSFAQYAALRGDVYVLRDRAQDWAAKTSTSRQRAKRLAVLLPLARFLHAEDPRHELLPRPLADTNPARPLRYLFTLTDLRRLVQAAGRLPPRRSLRPHTFRTLFGLLGVTGLRISEALNLRLSDLSPDGLVIRDTKFHKHRLVPLHPTTADAVTQYVERRQRLPTVTDHVFVSLKRTSLCYRTAYSTFRELCRQLGLPQTSGGRDHACTTFGIRSPCVRSRPARSPASRLRRTCWPSVRIWAMRVCAARTGICRARRGCSSILPRLVSAG